MLPEAWCEETLVVAMLVQAFFKEFLSKIPGLQEVEHSFLNFDVDESMEVTLSIKLYSSTKSLGRTLSFMHMYSGPAMGVMR